MDNRNPRRIHYRVGPLSNSGPAFILKDDADRRAMGNALILTRVPLSDEDLLAIERQGWNARVVHVFGNQVVKNRIEELGPLTWPEHIFAEDVLMEAAAAASKPVSRLSDLGVHPQKAELRAEEWSQPAGGILFVPCNDTHVKMFLPIANMFPRSTFLVIRGENAEKFLEEHNRGFEQFDLKLFHGDRYKAAMRDLMTRTGSTVVVMANDFTGENRRICELCREDGIPTVCIEEGPQDFDLEGGKWRQMQHADYIFSQGAITVDYLTAKRFVITGNPRLSGYTPQPLPGTPKVMVNCNFTYNRYEDWRDRWIGDCVAACDALELEYFISQHPRDNGHYPDLNVIPSNAFVIADQINSANVLITRFSQVAYEAMLSGRQVVYYNPHGEVKRVLTDDASGAMFLASDLATLKTALSDAMKYPFTNEPQRNAFLNLHCGPCDGGEVERIIHGLAMLSRTSRGSGGSSQGPAISKGSALTPEEIRAELDQVVAEFGPYTAQNMRLADGVYTIDTKTNYDHFKVHRIKQLVADAGYLSPDTRILDIGSLQSMFALEFALEGLQAVSIEGRRINIEKGRFAARAMGAKSIEFHQDDVNNISTEKYGEFDVILCMGILYHIAKDKYLNFLKSIAHCCKDVLIIDTFVSLHEREAIEMDGVRYLGMSWREFEEGTDARAKEAASHSSLSDNMSFSMTKPSLIEYLGRLGFTTISEVSVPRQPIQPRDRITLLCRKGVPVTLNVFPEFTFERDFATAGDSRGTQGQDLVFWNRLTAGDAGGSLDAIDQDIKPLASGRSKPMLQAYSEIFSDIRTRPLNILELGTRNAGSLALFGRYFLQSRIVGLMQQRPDPGAYEQLKAVGPMARVDLCTGSPADRVLIDGILDAHFHKDPLDIVFDNASHLYDDTKKTFDHLYFSRLRPGGYYVIESWGCGYWPKWPDGNADGLHGLPLLVKQFVDEVARPDRTKEFKGVRALPAASIEPSSIAELIVVSGAVILKKA